MALIRKLRALRARLQQEDGGYTLAELLVAIVICGTIAGVIGAAFIVGSKTTVEAGTRLRESHDAQLLTNYFRADAASAGYFSPTVPPPGCGLDAGETPVALFGWVDYGGTAPVHNSALYFRQSNTLTRRYCEGNVKQSDVAVVKNLSATTTPTVACPPLPSCTGALAPSQVLLTVTEASDRYSYTVQAANRTDPASDSPLLGNVSVYVGADLSLNSTTKVIVNNGGLAYIGNVSKCTNKAGVVGDVVFTANKGGCGSDADVDTFPDPLSTLAVPAKPATNGSSGGSCKGKTAWNPGYYSTKLTVSNGCLKSGVYYLDNGASFSNVVSEDAGVLIYVNKASSAVTFDGVNTLVPLETGAISGVSLYLRRDLPGTILIQPSSGAATTIEGIIYAAAGSLELKNNNATLNLGGAVVVRHLTLTGNSSVSIS